MVHWLASGFWGQSDSNLKESKLVKFYIFIPRLCLILRLVCAELLKVYDCPSIPLKIFLIVSCKLVIRWLQALTRCPLVLSTPPLPHLPAACKSKRADIIFLIDGSESIAPKDFEKMKEFMERMVNQSNIGADEIRMGLLQFSSTPREEFRLNQYSSKVDMRRAILNVEQMNDGTRTGKGLNFTLPFFDSSRGGRPSVHQYLIVITDGISQDSVAAPAKALRDRNIIIFAIGVGEAQRAQLLEITNDQDRVYHEENFEFLQNLEKEILYEVCSSQGKWERSCWVCKLSEGPYLLSQ